MSKEQIKIICDDARVITDNDNKMIRCHINIKHFNWLIEQAERVQELEQLKIAFDELDSDYIDLQKQNKRYRELLDEILELQIYVNYSESDLYKKVLKIMNRYLDMEGESDE